MNQALFFWNMAEPLLANPNVSKGTMMGLPCLRINGDFFASAERITGDLIVKLSEERVLELIDANVGQPFVPAGRRFREWVQIVDRDEERWGELLEEAQKFVEAK